MNRSIRVAILLLTLIVVMVIARHFTDIVPGPTATEGPDVPVNTKPTEYPYYADVLTPSEMKADLTQLREDLANVHPKAKTGLPAEYSALLQEAMVKVQEELTVGEFFEIVAPLVCCFQDGHTLMCPPYGGRFFPAEVVFFEDKLFALGGVNLQAGDELLSLGGISVEQLVAYGEQVISTENPYWLKKQIPFLLNETILAQMGAEFCAWRTIEVELIRSSNVITVKVNLGQTYLPPDSQTGLSPSSNGAWGYRIDSEANACVFSLRECEYDGYCKFLADMFKAIKDNRIKNLIVDLRGNPGGSSGIIEGFLRYIDIDEYKDYGFSTRKSKAYQAQRGELYILADALHQGRMVKNDKKQELIFSGDIYILVDGGTFSAASLFAVVLADNNLGETIGSPTGNTPSFYADALEFQLDNSKLFYNISSCKFIRPNHEQGEELDAFYPDYHVTSTIEDYVNQNDRALEAARTLIKEKP